MGTFSSNAFFNRFHEFARQRRLFDNRSKIIVAVSGGIDSSVLLDLLVKERDAYGLGLIVAHFNHQLRGAESDGDEQHVKHRATSYGLDFYVERANTAEYARQTKAGIQEAARDLRYEFFEKLLVSSGFGRVATAHTADDNAETILLNLFRGAGIQGLSGIPVYRADKQIIRPLIFAPRQEIELYARRNGFLSARTHPTRPTITRGITSVTTSSRSSRPRSIPGCSIHFKGHRRYSASWRHTLGSMRATRSISLPFPGRLRIFTSLFLA